MFKKGTGDRFSYKEAVLEKFPDAVCKRSGVQFVNQRNFTNYGFAVFISDIQMTDTYSSAENAWANAWANHVKKKTSIINK